MIHTNKNWRENLKERAIVWGERGCNWDDRGADPIGKDTAQNICLIIDKLNSKMELAACIDGELALSHNIGDFNINILCLHNIFYLYISSEESSFKDKLVGTYGLNNLDNLLEDFYKNMEYLKNRKEIFDKLEQIMRLKDNWNNNGAKAISKEVYDTTYLLLKHCMYNLEIFPTACDSIQLEYEKDNRYLEIECLSDRYEIYIKEDERVLEANYEIYELYRVINEIKMFFNGKPEKSVLFSGAFNPPTIAHKHMIGSAINNGDFDYVIFALSNERFLSKKMKKNGDNFYFSEEERLNMILEMTWKDANVLIYGIERGYTYDVLKDTKLSFNIPELYFAFGSDKLKEVERWGHSNLLLTEFCFYVLKRMDSDEYVKTESERIFANTKYIIGTDNKKYENISSTMVREMLKNNSHMTKEYLYDGVYNYIKKIMKDDKK